MAEGSGVKEKAWAPEVMRPVQPRQRRGWGVMERWVEGLRRGRWGGGGVEVLSLQGGKHGRGRLGAGGTQPSAQLGGPPGRGDAAASRPACTWLRAVLPAARRGLSQGAASSVPRM